MTAVDTETADRVDAEAAAKDTVGWSRLGYEQREPTWDDSDLAHVAGRTVVVTGSTAGLGLAAAQRLAGLGARVVLVSRDAAKLERVAAEIGDGVVGTVTCDLGSLASVRAAAASLLEMCPEIHVLVNNAGILIHEHLTTEDGFEKVWATNLLGPYLLTELLLPRLVESAPARVIEVTSGGMYSQKIDVEDHQTLEKEYEGRAVYTPHQARPGHPHRAPRRAARRLRRRLPLHAPRLGRHPRRLRVHPRLRREVPGHPPHPRPGRGHHRLARRRRPARHLVRAALAGPASS